MAPYSLTVTAHSAEDLKRQLVELAVSLNRAEIPSNATLKKLQAMQNKDEEKDKEDAGGNEGGLKHKKARRENGGGGGGGSNSKSKE